MRATEANFEGGTPVDGYGPGAFRVGGAVHRGPLALLPSGVVAWSGPPDWAPLLERASEFDVLLVGSGVEMAPPEGFAAARSALEANGAGAEFMSTPSAARTYNVLLAEGRRVAAALVPV